MSKPLRTCPQCCAWLDSGERCDCQDTTANDTAPEAGNEADQQTENPHEPVLTAGA